MSRPQAGLLVTLIVALGWIAYLGWTPSKGKGRADAKGEEQLALKALPVEHAEELRASGVYPWRWRVGLPGAAAGRQWLILRHTSKDGPKRLVATAVPTSEEARSSTTEFFVVVHFDARTPMEADRMVCSITYGGMTNRVSRDNPFKLKGATQNVFRHLPDARDSTAELMTVSGDGDVVPLKLELAIVSRLD